ncbi:hypothetical protein, partial [Hydrocarboniphaga effusa]|uniref:hypothetical protein n=1 Tax=Hydrocarboniphaga effusa TaxID=243629 RepID=UPI0035AEB940
FMAASCSEISECCDATKIGVSFRDSQLPVRIPPIGLTYSLVSFSSFPANHTKTVRLSVEVAIP